MTRVEEGGRPTLETKIADLLTTELGPATIDEDNLKTAIKSSFIPWLKKKISPRTSEVETVLAQERPITVINSDIESAISLLTLKEEQNAMPVSKIENFNDEKPVMQEDKPLNRKKKKKKSGNKRSRSQGRSLHPRAKAFLRRLSAMSASSTKSDSDSEKLQNVNLFQCQKINATPKQPAIKPAFMKTPLGNSVSLKPIHRRSLPNGLSSSIDFSKKSELQSIDFSKKSELQRVYGSNSVDNLETIKTIKVYLSEKQSGSLTVNGIINPCAPPVTPLPGLLQKYEYVPSMTDFKAQRELRGRLEGLEKKEKLRQEKKEAEAARLEKQYEKDKEKQRRIRQRQEIYALNKAMTELEYERFQEFCKSKGISPDG